MTDVETDYHESWLGMVQPTEGLVVSVPVLRDAQCMNRLTPSEHHRFAALCPPNASGQCHVADLDEMLGDTLGLGREMWDRDGTIPPALIIVDGQQVVRPTRALRYPDFARPELAPVAGSAAARAAAAYAMLVWDVPLGLDLDKAEATTGPWRYPPAGKFDRLLRHSRVPIGLLTNRRDLRLVYAPPDQATGSITFRVPHMVATGGRPILEAFVMLLSHTRWFGVAEEHQLHRILADSRARQADVTTALAKQVLEALQILLAGFESAAERDDWDLLGDALERSDDHLYGGLLTVLLRLVFLLYAEDRELLPVDDAFYAEHLSVLALYDQLQRDRGLFPDTMSRRFGAWGRLLAVFRAVYLGAQHASLRIPARRGELFDPHRFPFLEGWGPGGSAPISQASDRAAVRVPTIDDGTVYDVLHRLRVLDGQRLSYRTLDVEQIGSVYEALMGYHVVRLPAPAMCLQPRGVWVTAQEIIAARPADKWLQAEVGLSRSDAKKLAAAIKAVDASDPDAVLSALATNRAKGSARAPAGRLVLQPGRERRRSSSHYTPRSWSEPVVRRTLEPLLASMKPFPKAKAILDLKVCDPAMGSGAFLVQACRFLGEHLVRAWSREGQLERIAGEHPDVDHHARRLIAQRCLYGIDRNPFAVSLAKLSLWLATLAKDEPFTFVDHALRCGDALVGLTFEQLRGFAWSRPKRPGKGRRASQAPLFATELEHALSEAIELRQRICDLAAEEAPPAQRERERLLEDAVDAMDRIRAAADLCVGAFFDASSATAREAERARRFGLVEEWLGTTEPLPAELLALRERVRTALNPFHWGLEFPEVFFEGRPDPLDEGRTNQGALFDAFIGNPPFAGKNGISDTHGDAYLPWLQAIHEGAHGNADYSAHFFRRCSTFLGRHGTIGLIATNTIGQGDTRATGLQPLVCNEGCEIYEATSSTPWPGDAAVSVAVVHLARGRPASACSERRLDDLPVAAIDSRLRGQRERDDPQPLHANAGLSFQGSIVLGMGFTLTPPERDALVAKDPRNAERIFPYLGSEEINTSPTQTFDRYVINFGTMELAEAETWPDLMAIVREKVKPARDQNKRAVRSKFWWRFGETAPALNAALVPLKRCLVTGRNATHLTVAFQPTDRVFSEQLIAFPLERYGHFAVLQSRVHAAWAWLLMSTMKADPRYTPSRCFETFPFPIPDPRAVSPTLDAVGERLYTARAAHMVAAQQGLTATYHELLDTRCVAAPIVELRRLHDEQDRAVLAAYREHAGWPDIPIPPYGTPSNDAERAALHAFEDTVIEQLFALNAERAAAEEVASTPSAPRRKRRSTGNDATLFEDTDS